MAVPDLRRLFEPSSIAVVGASPSNPWSLGLVENLSGVRFGGEVAAVNPRYESVAGVPCFPSLKEIPHPVDAVLIGVRAANVPAVVAEAAEAGIGAAVVLSGGFAEAGPEGRRLQDELTRIASEAGIALVGPNCQGTINLVDGNALYLDRIPEPLPVGSTALISQSGTILTALLNNSRGIRFSHAVSSGNEAGLNAGAMMDHLLDDPRVTTIAAFLETIRDVDTFLGACDKAARLGKSIVVLKVGETEAAMAAAAAHTGALAVPHRLVAALMERHGVLLVKTLEEMLEVIAAVSCARGTGRRLAAITFSGGLGELIQDRIDPLDLTLPRLADPTVRTLEELGFHSPGNPLDAWGALDYQRSYGPALEALVADPSVDALVACVEAPPIMPTSNREVFEFAVNEVVRVASGTEKQMAVLNTMSGGLDPAVSRRLEALGVIPLSGVEQGLRSLAAAAAPASAPVEVGARPAGEAEPAGPTPGPGYSGLRALGQIASSGVPIVETVEASGADEAAAAAERIGFPVVVKTADPEILHKTEAGGVFPNLTTAEQVRRAAAAVAGEGDGPVLVQAQAAGGVELILGLQTHPDLGTFVMVGLGGIWTEILDDVALAPVPLREGDAERMLGRLRFGRLLDGVRGERPVDRAALTGAIEALADWGARFGDGLESVDLNPVFASPDGVSAVDAVVVPAG